MESSKHSPFAVFSYSSALQLTVAIAVCTFLATAPGPSVAQFSSAGRPSALVETVDIDEERPVDSVAFELAPKLQRLLAASNAQAASTSGCRYEYTQSSRALQEWLGLDEKTGAVRVKARIDREELLERSCFPSQAQALLNGWSLQGHGPQMGQYGSGFAGQAPERSGPCECRSGGGQGLGSGMEPANCSMGQVMYMGICGDEPRAITFRVVVRDIDDHRPRFSTNSAELSVLEHSPRGTIVELPVALDRDGPQFSNVSYELNVTAATVPIIPFAVRKRGGRHVLEVVGDVDHEKVPVYYFNLTARNGWDQRKVMSWVTLKVVVNDANDHSPQFDRPSYSASVAENAPLRTLITTVRATDRDSGDNAAIEYSFDDSALNIGVFELDPTNGEIRVASPLDYEHVNRYEFLVIASDRVHSQGDGERRRDTATVVVSVLDVNDEAASYTVDYVGVTHTDPLTDAVFGSIVENLGETSGADYRPAVVAHVTVTDRDTHRGGLLHCRINDTANFQISEAGSPNLYRLSVRRAFDRELNASVTVNFSCSDSGLPPLESFQIIPFRIADVNDNDPRFEKSVIDLNVSEEVRIGEPVGEVVATDRDEGENAELTYALLPLCRSNSNSGPGAGSCPGDATTHFRIESSTGRISALSTFDRETQDRYTFLVTATDRGREPRTSSATVNVQVIDSNDCTPKFIFVPGTSGKHYTFEVNEGAEVGHRLGAVHASDCDVGQNAALEYVLGPPLQPAADHEIRAGSGVPVPLSTSYSSTSFELSRSGELSLKRPLDREQVDEYRFSVLAIDQGGPRLTGTAEILVRVRDDNDNAPRVTGLQKEQRSREYVGRAVCEQERTLCVSFQEAPDAHVAQVLATDGDQYGSSNAHLSYSLVSVTPIRHRLAAGSAGGAAGAILRVEPGTGALAVGRRLSESDAGEYAVCVQVSDQGHTPLSTRFNFTLVLDGARLDPYAAHSVLTGSHAGLRGGAGSGAGGADEQGGVTGTTLALLVVTVIAVLFALTFVLLVLLYLHYKRKLRAESESDAEAGRSKRSRESPSSTSLRLLRMCVCLCGGGARREAKRVLAGENDAMLAVPASVHAPANEAPANDFESRVEHFEMVAPHEARHTRRDRAIDGQHYSAASANDDHSPNRIAAFGSGGAPGIERTSSRRAHRGAHCDVDQNANVFKPIAAGEMNASESMMTMNISDATATASLPRGALPGRERDRSCGPRTTADRDASRRRRERSEEPVYAEFPQGTLSRGYGGCGSTLYSSDNSGHLSQQQQQQQHLYHTYARPESFLGNSLPAPTSPACAPNSTTLPSLSSFIPYPANANQLGQLSLSPAGAQAGQLTLVSNPAAAAQFGYPGVGAGVPIYPMGTQKLTLDPTLLTTANFNSLAAAGVPMVMPNMQGTYTGLGSNSILPYAYTMYPPAGPNVPAPALTRVALDESIANRNVLALLPSAKQVASQQLAANSGRASRADVDQSRALAPRGGAFSPVGSSTMGKRSRSTNVSVRRRPSELGTLVATGVPALQHTDGINSSAPNACVAIAAAADGAIEAPVMSVPSQHGAAAIAAVASGELQSPPTPSSARAASGHSRLYSVVKGSFV